MSSAPVSPAGAGPAPVPVPPAPPTKPLSAIQVIEQELANFARQEEMALSQLHAVKGAIQAATFLLQRLKAEEQKAVEFAKAEFEKVKAATAPIVAEGESLLKNVEGKVAVDVEKVATAIKSAL